MFYKTIGGNTFLKLVILKVLATKIINKIDDLPVSDFILLYAFDVFFI
jgi:hypothetical protein